MEEKRTERINLRVTKQQQLAFNRAAATQGIAMSQWAIATLTRQASQDIENELALKIPHDAYMTLLSESQK